jgi:hypothetical protein
MHDGAPAHFNRAVRDVLSNTYHDRWIGRRETTAWPLRPSDLNRLNFLTVRTPKNPCVCSSSGQRIGTSPSHCGCLSHYPQLPQHH